MAPLIAEAGHCAWLNELLASSGCTRLSMPLPSAASQLRSLEQSLSRHRTGLACHLTRALVATQVTSHQFQQGSLCWHCTDPIVSTQPLRGSNGPWLVLAAPPDPGPADAAMTRVTQAVALPILSAQVLVPVNNAYERAVLFQLIEYFERWRLKGRPVSLQCPPFEATLGTGTTGAVFWLTDERASRHLKLVVVSDVTSVRQASTSPRRVANAPRPAVDPLLPVLEFNAVEADAHGTWDARMEKLMKTMARHFGIKSTALPMTSPRTHRQG